MGARCPKLFLKAGSVQILPLEWRWRFKAETLYLFSFHGRREAVNLQARQWAHAPSRGHSSTVRFSMPFVLGKLRRTFLCASRLFLRAGACLIPRVSLRLSACSDSIPGLMPSRMAGMGGSQVLTCQRARRFPGASAESSDLFPSKSVVISSRLELYSVLVVVLRAFTRSEVRTVRHE